MNQDICCLNFKGLIAYLRECYGVEGLRLVLDGLIGNGRYKVADKYHPLKSIAVEEDHLSDPTYWVSNDFSLQLLSNVKNVVPGPEPLVTAGEQSIVRHLSHSTLLMAKIFGFQLLLRQAPKINRRFNRTKEVSLRDFDKTSAFFELDYKPGYRITKDVCNWNRGVYIGITKAAGMQNVTCEELKCVVEGDACCLFRLTWKNPSLKTTLAKWIMKAFLGKLLSDYESTLEDRDQLIQHLRQSEEKYRDIFENAVMGIFQTIPEGKIISANRAFARILKYDSPEELVNTITDLAHQVYVHPEQRLDFLRIMEESGNVHEFETQFLRKDGSTAWISINARTVRDGSGTLLFYEGTVQDISERQRVEEERRELEERLHRAEKMEALGTLAGGVAHDLNNVLGIVIGYSELLLQEVAESSPIRRRLEHILDGGEKSAAIVQDLLTLARRGVPSRKVINLNTTIADYQTSPEFARLASHLPSVHLRIDLEPNLLNLSGSSVHLGKTLHNLVLNALESMPGGGLLTIQTANQYLDKPIQGYDEVREGDYVVLSVSDTGEGIPAADIKRIFEPFYTKKVMGRSGTGLGLAVVWGTVKDHNGYINVESVEGKGSVFTLYLPVTREEMTEDRLRASVSEYMGHGESIMVVDDVKGQRELAAEMLRKLNYTAVSVSSGEEAVNYLRENAVDLVVLDMIMDPGMDGLDTYKKIIEIRPGQKAIIVSGFSETDRVSAAQILGAGAYIKKPYVLERLGLGVRKELDKSL